MMRLLKITVEKECEWLGTSRWRITAITSESRVITFVMYSVTEPTHEDAQIHYNTNHGEAIDVTPATMEGV
jgi:hypothetical protein